MDKYFKHIINFIRETFGNTQDFIPLHEPRFIGKEKEFILETVESTFVSSVGKFVNEFEQKVADYTGSPYAVAVVNGTSALHLALLIAGVKANDEVITQPLTFIATANAIKYLGAYPVFIDISPITASLDPEQLDYFLKKNTELKQIDGKGICINKITGRRITACVPVHIFGHPAKIDEIVKICDKYNIPVIEDAAESLGTFYKGKHTGTFGRIGILSFNGNKIITTGGGGMILTSDEKIVNLARHLSTQAKVPHPWEYIHDAIGYNYRLTNLQAALGLAQMENLEFFIERKRWLATQYQQFFNNIDKIEFFTEPPHARSNYWLNAIMFGNLEERNKFLEFSNNNGIQSRAVWKLIPELPIFKDSYTYSMNNAKILYERTVNIPSSVII